MRQIPHQVMRPQTEVICEDSSQVSTCRARLETEDGKAHVGKVAKDGAGVLRTGRHVREERERDADDDTPVRQAPAVGRLEEARSLAVQGETVEGTRRGVQVGRGGRPGGGEEASVDDRGESLDAGVLDGNDERRRDGRAGTKGETRVVRGNEQTSDEGSLKKRTPVSSARDA